MNSIPFYYQTNWPLLFVFAYFLLFIIIIMLMKKGHNDFLKIPEILKSYSNDSDKYLEFVDGFIKKHPFYSVNSVLRLLKIPFLVSKENEEEIKETIKKIRASDIDPMAAEYSVFALFALKESELFKEEYKFLKNKLEKRCTPLKEDIYCNLIAETITAENIPEELYSNSSDTIKAIAHYYRGVDLLKSGDKENAEKQFEASQKLIPSMTKILERKGLI